MVNLLCNGLLFNCMLIYCLEDEYDLRIKQSSLGNNFKM